jgi:hypothetical protein
MIGVAFCISIHFSRTYWGYCFARPALLPEIGDIAQVTAVIPVQTKSDDSGKRTIVPRKDFSLAKCIAYAKKDPYYCLDERILIELERKGLLPDTHTTTLKGLPELHALIRRTGIMAEPEDGYDISDVLSGVVVNAFDKSGSRLVVLVVTGGQVSNDHYPYYEMVFSGQKGSTELSFMRGQRFFYDIACIEGVEWYVVWPGYSLLAIVTGFALFTIAVGMWNAVQKWRKARPPSPEAATRGADEEGRGA